ncbi:vitamin K epoxide reductase [Actinoalloteichus sp. AHMU CJ021]|uniref:Membrane protein n=1 Tax=Actinoalloteichus caeruleus DSM 43889 TaxID=1120930 RepID=A0ABT1JJM1_ACTCY|nr:vitamin K epoxide reductase family protein [Actinoalloteichus caeruleus]AUS78411.1 vitamin K epoxide reductase [Actinoalloteichus sp. AHMU CJ021]MCP2332494.1 putative membrane protein [Actinoalloteichus caeruleus DSM 43889]
MSEQLATHTVDSEGPSGKASPDSREPGQTGSEDLLGAPSPTRGLGWLLTVGGFLGFLASFVLMVERIELLKDPLYIPSCSLDAVLSCGSVMTTPQAALFGFPNPLIGVAAFPAVVTVGAAVLAGARLPRWFWLGLQLGATLGTVFVHWLMFQSFFNISALCPYCMVVWAVTVPIFWYTTTHNIERGHLRLGGFGRALVAYRGPVLAAWALSVVGLVVAVFWTHWSQLLS